jgi:hypothetical protein
MMPVRGAAHDDQGGDMNGRRIIVLLLAALARVAAGCGGDDSNQASADTETTAVEETTGGEATETTSDTTSETTDDDEISLSGKCAEFAGLGAKISAAMSGGNAGLDEASALFDELASQVPGEIKADFKVIADNFAKLADALKEIDLAPGETPSPDDLAKLQELTASLDSAEVQQASANIEKWAQKNC